jgi:hypothetical protein
MQCIDRKWARRAGLQGAGLNSADENPWRTSSTQYELRLVGSRKQIQQWFNRTILFGVVLLDGAPGRPVEFMSAFDPFRRSSTNQLCKVAKVLGDLPEKDAHSGLSTSEMVDKTADKANRWKVD